MVIYHNSYSIRVLQKPKCSMRTNIACTACY